VRVAILAVWIAVAIAVVLPLLRRRSWPVRRPPRTSDELVKDPVCGTYIVRSRAISRAVVGGPQYFCSAECARRFGR
jgi:YHS domain-containing protein